MFSGLLLFLLGRREQDVVQDEPVPGRVFAQGQVGGRIAHQVGEVLGVVPGVEGECPLAIPAVEILDRVFAHQGSHDDHRVLQRVASEGGGLAQESPDAVHVVLSEDGGGAVELGGELEQIDVPAVDELVVAAGINIDIGKLVDQGIHFQAEIGKSQ